MSTSIRWPFVRGTRCSFLATGQLSKETAPLLRTCLLKHILAVFITLLWLLPSSAQQHGQGHSERRGPSDIQIYRGTGKASTRQGSETG